MTHKLWKMTNRWDDIQVVEDDLLGLEDDLQVVEDDLQVVEDNIQMVEDDLQNVAADKYLSKPIGLCFVLLLILVLLRNEFWHSDQDQTWSV